MRIPRITRGQAVAVIAMSALVAGTFWLRNHTTTETSNQTSLHPPAHANYYARNIRVTTMNAKGAPLYILHAAGARRYRDDSADMNQVQLRYTGNRSATRGKGEWHLRGDHGHRPPGGSQRIRLKGHVVLDGQTANGVPLSLHTSTLTLFMENKKARTAAPVRVASGKRTLTATGMRANLKNQEVHFLKDVHATITP